MPVGLSEPAVGVLVRNVLKMLVAPSLLKTGFITGKQALMTPSKASRQVRRAIIVYCCGVFCAVMSVVTLTRATVMAQILCEISAGVLSLFDLLLRVTHATPIENIPVMITFCFNRTWRPHRTGIGSATVVTSIKRLNTPMKRSRDF